MKMGATEMKQSALLTAGPAEFVDLAPLAGPRFLVTVDTEEEFDWDGPFSRDNTSLDHLTGIPRFQKLCEEFGAKPVYMVDWPIVENNVGSDLFGAYADQGAASLGIHLHPWVTPPFTEEVNARNSYANNLPPQLERDKICAMYELLRSRLGVSADIYRAGRYGAGPHTAEILSDLNIPIDSSVRARFDYASQHGPDFSASPIHPYWLKPGLLELPVTTVFSGRLRAAADMLFLRTFTSETSRAIMAKAGLVERIALTPEGIPLDGAIKGIDRALEEGIGILNFSFHSPSLAVGYTPYVRSESDLEQFYAWWRGVFAHLAKRGCAPVSVEEIAALAI